MSNGSREERLRLARAQCDWTQAIAGGSKTEIPTVADFVSGYESSTWYGLGAPKRTPPEIIERLNVEINAALADPTLRARLADLGGTAIGGSPADFGRLIAADTEKWAKVVKFANIKPE